MASDYKGSCLCGEIKFSVSGFGYLVGNCHCTMCRKFHGAAYATLVAVHNLQWHGGLALLKDYVATNGTIRSFCKECGSSIGFRQQGAPLEQIEMAVSTFDSSIPIAVDAQIYTANKANWCELSTKVPVFKQGRV